MNTALSYGTGGKVNILAVDDEPYNLEIIEEYLQDAGFSVDLAANGDLALEILTANPGKYHTILLDRMMPGKDGLAVLRELKLHKELRFVPIIMQSAKATITDIQEGLNHGVIYYLTKPFERSMLLDIVATSVSSFQQQLELFSGLNPVVHPAQQREFSFRTLEDARSLAILLSSFWLDRKRVIPGLCELLVNAVEHGIVGIGYEGKSRLLATGVWREEVERRLLLPENIHKCAKIELAQSAAGLRYTITDPGAGFDSEQYLKIDPGRAIHAHGRGIVVAKAISFDDLKFVAPGNQVVASLYHERGNH